MDELICCKCKEREYGIQNLIESHYRRSHAIALDQPQSSGFRCENGQCHHKHFLRFSSLIRHITTYHITTRNESQRNVNNSPVPEVNEGVPEDEDVIDLEEFRELANGHNLIDDRVVAGDLRKPIDIHCAASKMIANLRLNSSFTGANIDRVIDATDSFVSDVMSFVQHKITDFSI